MRTTYYVALPSTEMRSLNQLHPVHTTTKKRKKRIDMCQLKQYFLGPKYVVKIASKMCTVEIRGTVYASPCQGQSQAFLVAASRREFEINVIHMMTKSARKGNSSQIKLGTIQRN